MLGKIIGIILLAIPCSILLYLLAGAGTMFIYFNKWHQKKQFTRGIISTPVAVVMGVICWPLVLKAISIHRESRIFGEDPKKRVIDVVTSDRLVKNNFLEEWVRDYITSPKIDRESLYFERIYL